MQRIVTDEHGVRRLLLFDKSGVGRSYPVVEDGAVMRFQKGLNEIDVGGLTKEAATARAARKAKKKAHSKLPRRQAEAKQRQLLDHPVAAEDDMLKSTDIPLYTIAKSFL